jgi:hypothetical protein
MELEIPKHYLHDFYGECGQRIAYGCWINIAAYFIQHCLKELALFNIKLVTLDRSRKGIPRS